MLVDFIYDNNFLVKTTHKQCNKKLKTFFLSQLQRISEMQVLKTVPKKVYVTINHDSNQMQPINFPKAYFKM